MGRVFKERVSILKIRKIEKEDNIEVKQLIKTVMPEFGACGSGFAINDPEVENMFDAYQSTQAAYFVVMDESRIVGTGGIAPLIGGDGKTCELRKMYFYKESRGKGKGKELLELCLNTAKELGFTLCYLETLKNMSDAQALYKKSGFKQLDKPMGNTGHGGCDMWFIKEL